MADIAVVVFLCAGLASAGWVVTLGLSGRWSDDSWSAFAAVAFLFWWAIPFLAAWDAWERRNATPGEGGAG
jgi:tRNA U34 5-methylaminomethyl-2-thiouridine-forming methyltransferase MnmC